MSGNGLFSAEVPGSQPAGGEECRGSRDRPFTVTEISAGIRSVLEAQYPSVWVEGEVGSLRAPGSGHLYLNLKDEECQLRVVIFRGVAETLVFKVADGQKVRVRGRVSAYAGRSEYQVIARAVEVCGEGDLLLKLEKLKRKLEARGLFAPERKRRLPMLIGRLGVVTSPAGAALRDIRSVFRRRYPGLELVVYPALVQGPGAAAELRRGLEELNRIKRENPAVGSDAILLTRGGGSLEDLQAFNDEALAESIFRSEIPVISAVGHRTDTVISDLVADFCAPTPSAAAERISLDCREMADRLRVNRDRLSAATGFLIGRARQALEALRSRYGFRRPQDLVENLSQKIDDLGERLTGACSRRFCEQHRVLEALERNLAGLSPLAVLERGYSITRLPGGKVLRDAAGLEPGREILTRLARGEVASRVSAAVPGKSARGGDGPAPPGKGKKTGENPGGAGSSQGSLF